MPDESPVEPFKRALAHAARSLAETPDLEVVFSNEGPALYANRAVLPHPPRDLPPRGPIDVKALPGGLMEVAFIAEALQLLHGPRDPALFQPNTAVLYLESPGSYTFEMQDIRALCDMGHRHDLVTMLDNTWGIQAFQPFALVV